MTVNVNPLRLDPTRTFTIRKRFVSEINRRFHKLKVAINDFMVVKDALGLKERKHLVFMAEPREFEFRTDPGKLQAFKDWLLIQIQIEILSERNPADPWVTGYLKDAYKKGLINAYFASKQGQFFEEISPGIGEMTRDRFTRFVLGQPEIFNKLQILATRTFEDLKGVTAQMATEMNRILAQGMLDGSSPDKIAREMADRVDSLTLSRAQLIARTEVIRVHAEGQLDAFERLGVEQLGIKAEWSTAGDDRVCPQCSPLEGRTFTIEDARGMIPLHPNCRCSWIPSNEPSR